RADVSDRTIAGRRQEVLPSVRPMAVRARVCSRYATTRRGPGFNEPSEHAFPQGQVLCLMQCIIVNIIFTMVYAYCSASEATKVGGPERTRLISRALELGSMGRSSGAKNRGLTRAQGSVSRKRDFIAVTIGSDDHSRALPLPTCPRFLGCRAV